MEDDGSTSAVKGSAAGLFNFVNAKRVLLVGSSAGGLAAHIHADRVGDLLEKLDLPHLSVYKVILSLSLSHELSVSLLLLLLFSFSHRTISLSLSLSLSRSRLTNVKL